MADEDQPDARIEEAARILVREYGDAALVIASVTADEMIAKRDQPGLSTWLLIRAAVRRRLRNSTGAYGQ